MELDTVEQRHKFIKELVSEAFAFEDSLIHDSENGDDWFSALNTAEDLVVVEEFIRTEEILLDALIEIEDMPFADESGRKIFWSIVNANLVTFVDEILLDRIGYAFDNVHDRYFATKPGIAFKKDMRNKLDILFRIYKDIYNLWKGF